MSTGNESCCMCMRMTEECGIVAGSTPGSLVCGSCASDVVETIQRKEEERAAEAKAPPTLEEEVLDTLKMSRKFIVDGLSLGHIKPRDFTDEEKKLLPALDTVIDKMREVLAA